MHCAVSPCMAVPVNCQHAAAWGDLCMIPIRAAVGVLHCTFKPPWKVMDCLADGNFAREPCRPLPLLLRGYTHV